ncbi:PepSY domain-containing protein [Pseudomonas sp.]|uniref:PepSY domain-containing protein n=1 Tax=Pseudomonas sp. TaxID=306 RepID=UPI0028AED42D|nr:PepSY domain-containing protein [Pseudomonas sp.]
MRKITVFLTASLLTASVAGVAWADQPGADWISKDQAEAALKAAGYTEITKIEADDGHWEGEGTKQDGMKYEFHVDPHSGKITKDEMDH